MPRLTNVLRPRDKRAATMLGFSPHNPYPPLAGDPGDWQRVMDDDMIDMRHLHMSVRGGQGRTLPEMVRANDGLALGALLATSPHRIDERDTEGWTALHAAVLAQRLDLVQVLLALHASPHLDGPERTMPLHLAAMLGNVDIAEALIASGAFIDAENEAGVTPLMLAADGGHAEVVARLLGKRALINKQATSGMSALSFAARSGDARIVDALLNVKANPHIADEKGMKPLNHAAAGGHDAAIKRLLDAKAVPNAADKAMVCALAHAAAGGHNAAVKVLLKARAYVQAADANGWTVLAHAAAGGHHATVALLLKAGADPNPGDVGTTSPLYLALRAGDVQTIKLLHKAGALAPETEEGLVQWFDGMGYAAARSLIKRYVPANSGVLARVFDMAERTGQAALMAATSTAGYHKYNLILDGKHSRIGRARGYDWGRKCEVVKPYMEKSMLTVPFDGLLRNVFALQPEAPQDTLHGRLLEAIRATGAFFTLNYALTDALCSLNDAWQVLPDGHIKPPRRRVENALAWVITTAAGMHDLVERPVETYVGGNDEPPSLRLPETLARKLAPLVRNQAVRLMEQATEVQKRLNLETICSAIEQDGIDISDEFLVVALLMNRFGLHALVARPLAFALKKSHDATHPPALKQAFVDVLNGPRFLKRLESDDIGKTLRPLVWKTPRRENSIDMARGLIVWQIDTLLASVE